jgi:hypothetical protein
LIIGNQNKRSVAGTFGRILPLLTNRSLASHCGRAFLVLAGLCFGEARGRAQDLIQAPNDLLQKPVVGQDAVAALLFGARPAAEEASASGRAARVRLSRMMPGFLSEPPGMDSSDDLIPVGDPAAAVYATKDGDGPSRVQVTMGADNPILDSRGRGDPGGVGFYRVHSQLQLFDSGTTSLCLNCQAFAPAGLESGGVADGPTVINPSVAVFQEMWGGSALQGYVGSNIRTASHLADRLEGGYHGGMAWQCPVPGLVNPSDNMGVYLYMQALGRYRYDGENTTGRPATFEFVPGIHWRVADSLWLSLGAARSSMLTCSWRF